jgi:hypothetical protein
MGKLTASVDSNRNASRSIRSTRVHEGLSRCTALRRAAGVGRQLEFPDCESERDKGRDKHCHGEIWEMR